MRGFTLVEMLVALAIFGLLAAAGVAVMRSAVDGQTAVRDRLDEVGQLQRLRALLKADLAQAAPRRTRRPDGGRDALAFAGAPGDGRLIGLVRRGWENPEGAPRASLQYVEYRLVDDRLERSVRQALDGAALSPPQVMIEGVRRAEVDFYGRQQWTPDWTVPDVLPEAVRLELSVEGLGEVSQLFLTAGGAR